jgi:hypothetical protein
MRLVLLKSVKDRFLGVDLSEQLVPRRARYGMPCLLNRDAIGSVSCSVVLGRVQCLAWDPHGARGACVGETLAPRNKSQILKYPGIMRKDKPHAVKLMHTVNSVN